MILINLYTIQKKLIQYKLKKYTIQMKIDNIATYDMP